MQPLQVSDSENLRQCMRFPTQRWLAAWVGTEPVFKGFKQRQESASKETKPEHSERHDENQATKQDC